MDALANEGRRVKQGGAAPTGKWVGNPQGGVTAPEPLILPDLALRFSTTAARLRALEQGHPMAAWLGFMSKLSDAQHLAATSLRLVPDIDPSLVAHSVEARMPPLAADGHRRNAEWHVGLRSIMDELANKDIPAAAVDAIGALRRRSADEIDALADDFLRGSLHVEDLGAALYVAAALQTYFTRLSSGLDATALRLLPVRGICPCCGSTPVSGLITAAGQTPGTRYLYCSLCSTAWNHVRAVCITCEASGSLSLKGVERGAAAVQAETCDNCQTYAKMLYQGKDTKVDPYADDLASLGLDIMVSEAGWARHAPNPLLLAA
jgi:FdhE protein